MAIIGCYCVTNRNFFAFPSFTHNEGSLQLLWRTKMMNYVLRVYFLVKFYRKEINLRSPQKKNVDNVIELPKNSSTNNSRAEKKFFSFRSQMLPNVLVPHESFECENYSENFFFSCFYVQT